MMNKATQFILKKSEQSAIKNTGWICRTFTHQPKVPAKLLEMKNTAENR